MAWQQYRTIVEEQEVTRVLDEARRLYPRLDHAWSGLCWLLCRRADKLGAKKAVDGVTFHLYGQANDPIAKTPRIFVVYWTDANRVIIRGVRIVDPAPEEPDQN